MKQKQLALPVFLLTLLFASLACTVFVGGPDTSDLTPIPVSTEAVDRLKEEIKKSLEAGAGTGEVTINITEEQITSYLAFKLQTDQSLQQSDKQPIITDPQVYLRDGQMKIYGKSHQGMFTANIGIVITIGVDEAGQLKIEITSADFGPFPAPEGLKEALTAMIKEAYTGALGPVATGLRIQTIVIANGVMTITGRIK